MAAINLKGMDVDALLALRTDIDKRLSQKRSELEKQLSRLRAESGQAAGIPRAVFGRRSALKGRKVAPTYRWRRGRRRGGRRPWPGMPPALHQAGRNAGGVRNRQGAGRRQGPDGKESPPQEKVGRQSSSCGCLTLAFVGK